MLLGVQVVRNAAVRALSEIAPQSAARVWPGHPDAELPLAMTEIAEAVREGRAVPPEVFDRVYGASRTAPLKLEPFLVRGVQAQLSGDSALAEQSFVQARWRDGRSRPARYFLAEHYLRRRDAARGLREIAVLARLVPDGTRQLAPYIARYANEPANQRQLRSLFRSEPYLEETALAVLAHDARNAALVLSLSVPEHRAPERGWVPLLIASLIADGQYARARKIWAEISRAPVSAGELIYDPRFTRGGEPPPFNWDLTSSTVGLAERQRAGGLRVIYYGQEDGPLASQLLILPPGTYGLSMKAAGAALAKSLSWILTCAGTRAPIATFSLDRAVGAGQRFTVASDCPAQRLELVGRSSDSPQQADLVVNSVTISRMQANG